MPNTKVGTTWAPDIRPEKIETFEETYTPEGGEEQTLTYRAVDHHPILGSVLDKLAFFRTHVGAVWYNLAERKTLLTKLNELDAELREVNAKIELNNFANPIDISAYNSADKLYTVPCDGYLFLNGNSVGSYARCVVYGAKNGAIAVSVENSNGLASRSIFVRKGMRAFIQNANDVSFQFIALI